MPNCVWKSRNSVSRQVAPPPIPPRRRCGRGRIQETMNTKVCTLCNTEKSVDDFYKRNDVDYVGYSSYCKECKKKKASEWRSANPDKNRENVKKYYRVHGRGKTYNYRKAARETVLKHYGNKCACCGEDKAEFLAIDHINGNGRKHRKEVGPHIASWLVRNNFPDGFRLLCHNCNQSLGIYGYCPHQKPK